MNKSHLDDSFFELRISKDSMLAFIKAKKGGTSYADSEAEFVMRVHSFLKENGVVYGILEEDILSFAQEYRDSGDDKEFLCAMGDSVQTGSRPSVVFADDIIIEKNQICNVIKDQVICYISGGKEIPAGVDVFGQPITPLDKRSLKLPQGENTYISSDDKCLHAKIDGCAEKIGNAIHVKKNIVVSESEYGFETEIDAFASILIKGDLPKSSVIKSMANIFVEGTVTEAELVAGGNITILKGVDGNDKTTISAGGSIAGTYFNNAKLNAGCDILCTSLYYCRSVARHAINAREKGTIIGGRNYAAAQIIAKQIGSPEKDFTSLRVGTSRKRDSGAQVKAELIHEEQKLLRDNLVDLEARIRVAITEINSGNQVLPDRLEFLNEAQHHKKKMVSAIRTIDKILAAEHSDFEIDRISLVLCNVCCSGTVYPNTHIEIGIKSLDVEQKTQNVRFYIGDERIESLPYKN